MLRFWVESDRFLLQFYCTTKAFMNWSTLYSFDHFLRLLFPRSAALSSFCHICCRPSYEIDIFETFSPTNSFCIWGKLTMQNSSEIRFCSSSLGRCAMNLLLCSIVASPWVAQGTKTCSISTNFSQYSKEVGEGFSFDLRQWGASSNLCTLDLLPSIVVQLSEIAEGSLKLWRFGWSWNFKFICRHSSSPWLISDQQSS